MQAAASARCGCAFHCLETERRVRACAAAKACLMFYGLVGESAVSQHCTLSPLLRAHTRPAYTRTKRRPTMHTTTHRRWSAFWSGCGSAPPLYRRPAPPLQCSSGRARRLQHTCRSACKSWALPGGSGCGGEPDLPSAALIGGAGIAGGGAAMREPTDTPAGTYGAHPMLPVAALYPHVACRLHRPSVRGVHGFVAERRRQLNWDMAGGRSRRHCRFGCSARMRPRRHGLSSSLHPCGDAAVRALHPLTALHGPWT